jgi:hypothetical protein
LAADKFGTAGSKRTYDEFLVVNARWTGRPLICPCWRYTAEARSGALRDPL